MADEILFVIVIMYSGGVSYIYYHDQWSWLRPALTRYAFAIGWVLLMLAWLASKTFSVLEVFVIAAQAFLASLCFAPFIFIAIAESSDIMKNFLMSNFNLIAPPPLNRVDAARKQGRTKEALQLLDDILAQDQWSKHPDVLMKQVDILEDIKDYEKAVRTLKILVQIETLEIEDITTLYLRMADYYQDHLHNTNQARAVLQELESRALSDNSQRYARTRLEALS